MALYLCKNSDGTGIIDGVNNVLESKHTSNGEPQEFAVYIFNDGKRVNVPSDRAGQIPLIYTNLQMKSEGVVHTLEQAITPSMADVSLVFDTVEGWNIGTIISHGNERMRIEEVLSVSSVRVTRNYTADGTASTLQSHTEAVPFIADASAVTLAYPQTNNYEKPATFLNSGEALKGLDPTNLINSIDNLETSKVIKSSNGSLYHAGSLIKIDNEIMKVISISGNDLTVLRGYSATARTSHTVGALILCVGIVDISPVTHKFFIKNSPKPGLPTQRKSDVMLVCIADEEPM